MINVVIPMAGLGSRFAKAGFIKPKPFIDVNGKPMIAQVLDNLKIPNARYILLAQREHIKAESTLVGEIEHSFGATFVPIDGLTEGTACTVLFARNLINNDDPLIIANSDQIVDFMISDFVRDCSDRKLDGSILTFLDKERNPKWSFADIDGNSEVLRVKEKDPISEYATVGIYLFSRGSDFVEGAIDMILKQDRVNGEYYTCPVYNYLIEKNKRVGIYQVERQAMHGLGTPEDLASFLSK